ncbi:arginine repressor [Thermophagus xiamenensis]|jgi:transcriptional regulator of arginine metabolism|uniref:Arginine repressor n=1 Tax=Thermophagus xiamenensis TaxID=385682 RepID=A0A1I1UIF4_9BACT|nr:arginine repressor [Thermophagus xiamenensis]SFD70636.1 transcriptional regulator, ArgR family [Thermophagus xiamenensis]
MRIKTQRLNLIRQLISKHKVGSQEELLNLLEAEGFSTTQATLSRDLKALKVAKRPDVEGGYAYVLPEDEDSGGDQSNEDVFPVNGLESIEFSGNMAVMKTRPGFANSIASIIDSQAPFEIIGTIAGDDTILLICKEGVSRPDVLNALSAFMPGIKKKLL